MSVTIHEVNSQHQFETFLNMPETLYADNFLRNTPSPNQMAEKLYHIPPENVTFYAAVENNLVVGRVAAMVNQRHPEKDTALFGYFESINSQPVANSLMTAVENWARSRGLEYVTGPVSYNTNDSIGMLVSGFDQPAKLGMPYNHHYYAQLLANSGYNKYFDLLAYLWSNDSIPPDKLRRVAERARKNKGVVLRPLNLFYIHKEAVLLAEIHNQTMQDNWGAEQLTLPEAKQYLYEYRSYADPDLLLAVEVNNEPAGICLTLPEWGNDSGRVAVMGVVPKYRPKGIAAMLIYETILRLKYKGYTEAEISLVMENNTMMNRILRDTLGYKVIKRFRVYKKKVN
jgi:ribosomal protein S18 acetylase RimI-like enzyme